MDNQINKRFVKVEDRITKVENLLKSGLSKNGRFVKCRCNWSWITRSKAKSVSCPGCGNKVIVKKSEPKKNG